MTERRSESDHYYLMCVMLRGRTCCSDVGSASALKSGIKMFYLEYHCPLECLTSYIHWFCRKASLALIRKMIHYTQPELMLEMCICDSEASTFSNQLVEVLAIVLDNEVRI